MNASPKSINKHREVHSRKNLRNNLVQIGKFVSNVVQSTERGSKICYPVLGSSGDLFLIEIASGEMKSRTILRSVYVELKGNQKDSIVIQSDLTGSEITISVIDASQLVALLGLFETALRQNTRPLHPLDTNGNYFKDWCHALNAASHGVSA